MAELGKKCQQQNRLTVFWCCAVHAIQAMQSNKGLWCTPPPLPCIQEKSHKNPSNTTISSKYHSKIHTSQNNVKFICNTGDFFAIRKKAQRMVRGLLFADGRSILEHTAFQIRKTVNVNLFYFFLGLWLWNFRQISDFCFNLKMYFRARTHTTCLQSTRHTEVSAGFTKAVCIDQAQLSLYKRLAPSHCTVLSCSRNHRQHDEFWLRKALRFSNVGQI